MNFEDRVETGEADKVSQSDSLISASMMGALERARERLLDRSLRNKLINTPLRSSKARQVRVFDELTDQVFAHLRSKKTFTFVAAKKGEAEPSPEGDTDVWVPNVSEDPDRHFDNRLQTQLTSEGLQKRLLGLFQEGQTLEEEQGVNVLFLALGFLEWREDKNSEIERFAPLILLPVDLKRDGARDSFKLTVRDEDLITNVSLQAWLKEQSSIEFPELPETDDWSPASYFDAVEKSIGDRPGWRVHRDEILLGFFSFAKFLLWRDLDPENWGAAAGSLVDNPLLKQLLLRDHDEGRLEDVPLVAPEERIDEVFRPSELIHVTDADSSQAIAIQEVMAGKNLVIQGPPGTGKSQTITNIIAGAVQRGKRVLFIAEKMAALDVVHERLKQKKLDPICLELHSRKSAKTLVLDQIKKGQKAASPPQWSEAAFDELTETQRRLRESSDRLHQAEPGKLSAFRIMGEIALQKARGVVTPDFQLPLLAAWTEAELASNLRETKQVADRLIASGTPALNPWRGAGLKSPDQLTRDRLRPAIARCEETTKSLIELAADVSKQFLVTPDASLNEMAIWIKALELVAARPIGMDNILKRRGAIEAAQPIDALVALGLEHRQVYNIANGAFRPEAFGEEWGAVRRNIATHGSSFFRFLSADYRDAVKTLRGVWRSEFPTGQRDRLSKIDALIDQQVLAEKIDKIGTALSPLLGEHWGGVETDWDALKALAGWIRLAKALEPEISVLDPDRLIDVVEASLLGKQLAESVAACSSAFQQIQIQLLLDWKIACDGLEETGVPITLLSALAIQWSQDLEGLVDWTAGRDGLAWLISIGCEPLAIRAFDGRISPEMLAPTLMLVAAEAMWSEVRERNPDVERILGDELSRLVERFKIADVDRIRLASDQTRRSHIDRHPTGSAGPVGILTDEMKKSRNLMPVRKLMLRAGEAIQKFKPVFLMSPLSVAQYLKPGTIEFDLLVIDEASQVRPEDALGAIARCKQLVVVGDDKQLPPTNFFNRMINDTAVNDDEAEGEGGIRQASVKDVESILNLCSSFTSRMLKWHYRSEHPALISTSNRNFYNGELMLPPSVVARTSDGTTGLIFHQIPEGGYDRGKTARNELEAGLIAEAVLKHARECPQLSLGIGTFSVAQRDCVRDCIDNLARENPELDTFLKVRAGSETTFIKNLENIQGDERDVIFISVGYGRDANGKLTQAFGPISSDGGERRLNVLITRARKRCEVFSSIVAEDVRFEGVGKPGVRAFKEFLKLARDGYASVALDTGRGFDSPFEEAVAASVRALGYDALPQVGMAGFFIDLAVIDPRDDGRYLLGIECDGAAYHSSQYARDRDRIRQTILESRGWKLHRIWSTDWFYKPEREIQKLKLAIEKALAVSQPTEPLAQEIPVVEVDHPVDEIAAIDAEPPADVSTGGRLAPYELVTRRFRGGPIMPQDLAGSELNDLLLMIVSTEQPIHQEEVGRRLAMCCGKEKAGRQIQGVAASGLRTANRRNELQSDGEFWSLYGAGCIAPRDRSVLESAASVRKPAMIAPSEIAAAAEVALESSLALEEAELVTEAARLLGFARVGPDVRAAIVDSVKKRVLPKCEVDHLGRLKLTLV